jgi:hypothetical protein
MLGDFLVYGYGFRKVREVSCKCDLTKFGASLVMNQVRLFRSIVLTSTVLYVVACLLPYDSFESNYAAVNLLRLDGYAARFNPGSWMFTGGILMLWLIASIGLLHFDSWARYLYLGLTAWALIAAGLYGIRVTSALGAVLDLAINLLDGAILALAFLSPLKGRFLKASSRGAP